MNQNVSTNRLGTNRLGYETTGYRSTHPTLVIVLDHESENLSAIVLEQTKKWHKNNFFKLSLCDLNGYHFFISRNLARWDLAWQLDSGYTSMKTPVVYASLLWIIVRLIVIVIIRCRMASGPRSLNRPSWWRRLAVIFSHSGLMITVELTSYLKCKKPF